MVAAVEGVNQIVMGNISLLSEQVVIDCTTDSNNDCNDGIMDYSFSYNTGSGEHHGGRRLQPEGRRRRHGCSRAGCDEQVAPAHAPHLTLPCAPARVLPPRRPTLALARRHRCHKGAREGIRGNYVYSP
ncbi:unnamed protein product [Urochloa humidicola]